MNEKNLKYIANLKVQDVPWSRLTTAYGRASGLVGIFEKLARAIEACDAAHGLGGEQNLDRVLNSTTESSAGQNSTDAARCGTVRFGDAFFKFRLQNFKISPKSRGRRNLRPVF